MKNNPQQEWAEHKHLKKRITDLEFRLARLEEISADPYKTFLEPGNQSSKS